MSNVEGLPQLRSRLKAIGDTKADLRTIQLRTIAGAKAKVPRKTGHLARSIVPGPVDRDTAVVIARTPYAAAVEFGSKPHDIRPKDRQALRWPAKGATRRLSGRATVATQRAGAWAFAKVVHHPGTKPKPYLIPAAKAAIGKMGSVIVDRWNDAA